MLIAKVSQIGRQLPYQRIPSTVRCVQLDIDPKAEHPYRVLSHTLACKSKLARVALNEFTTRFGQDLDPLNLL